MNLDFMLNENSRFNARCSAIIYNEDKNKILVFKIDGNNYYMLPGGRIEFNEDSLSAIKREILEETGYDLNFDLISVQENFVKKDDIDIMQYAFCFESICKDSKLESFKCLDNSSQTFYWIDVKNIFDYNIYPKSIYKLLSKKSNNILHIIEK